MTGTLPRNLHLPCIIRYWSAGPPDAQNNATDVWDEVVTVCQTQNELRQESPDPSDIPIERRWLVWLKPTERIPASTDELVTTNDNQRYVFMGTPSLVYDLFGFPDHIIGTAAIAEPLEAPL